MLRYTSKTRARRTMVLLFFIMHLTSKDWGSRFVKQVCRGKRHIPLQDRLQLMACRMVKPFPPPAGRAHALHDESRYGCPFICTSRDGLADCRRGRKIEEFCVTEGEAFFGLGIQVTDHLGGSVTGQETRPMRTLGPVGAGTPPAGSMVTANALAVRPGGRGEGSLGRSRGSQC